MKTKIKNTKGITLVALIITIIILLILAVVAITSISNSNIINNAKNAGTSYTEAEEKEKVTLAVHEAMLEGKGNIYKNGVENGMNAQFSNTGWNKINWDESEEHVRVVITSSNRQYKITLNIGKVEYEKYPGLKLGDIVNYKAQNSENIVWRVLSLENEQVLLVTEDNVKMLDLKSTDLEEKNLKAWDKTTRSYKNAEIYLDEMCREYVNSKYAIDGRSIRIDDIDKVTGYDKTTFKAGSTGDYGNELAYKRDIKSSYLPDSYFLYYQLNNSGQWMICSDKYTISDSYLTSLHLTEPLKNNFYSYSITKITDTTNENYNLYNTLFKNYDNPAFNYDYGYWLNSSFEVAPEPSEPAFGMFVTKFNQDETWSIAR